MTQEHNNVFNYDFRQRCVLGKDYLRHFKSINLIIFNLITKYVASEIKKKLTYMH